MLPPEYMVWLTGKRLHFLRRQIAGSINAESPHLPQNHS
jgi:hypothetical protein